MESVVTPEMLEMYKVRFNEMSDEAALGSLRMWEKGQGELDAALCNGNPTMFAVVEAYYKAKGQEVPESVKIPLVEVEENAPITDEKLPEESEAQM